MVTATVRHDSADALGPDHTYGEAWEMAVIVRGDQLVDQLKPSLVPYGFDEQPDLALVELAHARHRAG